MDATEAAWAAQPLWSLVPVRARAGYVRRASVAMLDELDDLALQLAAENGWPHAQLLESELLPAANGLRALADEGPRALADRRMSRRRATRIVHSPVGVLGLRGPSASPWAEPALETGAALLAGNSVIVDAPAAARLQAVFTRAGVPSEVLAAGDDLAGCARIVDLPRPDRRGLLLVLPGADRDEVVKAATWAAFGSHAAAAGRLVTVAGAVPGLLEALTGAAAALRVGVDVREPPSVAVVAPDDPRFTTPPEGLLAVIETSHPEAAIALAGRAAAVSVWARDLAQGERIARRLPSPVTWIGRHGLVITPVEVRIARHVVARHVERRAPWSPGTPRLPVDADAIEARRALAEARHGRESGRWAAFKALVKGFGEGRRPSDNRPHR